MSYYTERHKMRKPIQKTYEIDLLKYDVLLNTCEKFYENVAWRFPTGECCEIDMEKMVRYFLYEIPDLYGLHCHTIAYAMDDWLSIQEHPEEFNPFAIFDLIEFIYDNCKDIYVKDWYQYSNTPELGYTCSGHSKKNFRKEINLAFEKTGLLYTLTENGRVERTFNDGVLDSTIINTINEVKEEGLRFLLKDAVMKHRSPHPEDIRDSVEKIWDAFERLKTYYTMLDKKASVAKIVNDISNNQSEIYLIFETEFKALTEIGNNFRIRHHETNKVDISDIRHYDYFFNRCLSLISISIKYLKE